jgi:hypothetical protein
MKPMSGSGPAIKKSVLTAEESLRYAMSLPVTTTITGMEKSDVLEQNLAIAAGFEPYDASKMAALRSRCAEYADGRFELYKISLKYDNPEARLAHGFPLDIEQKEVKEMVRATENTGQPFPAAQ